MRLSPKPAQILIARAPKRLFISDFYRNKKAMEHWGSLPWAITIIIPLLQLLLSDLPILLLTIPLVSVIN